MLGRIARFIIQFRLFILLTISILTALMVYEAQKTKIVYEFAKLLPENDTTSVGYDNFKQRFGLDGNILLFSVQDSSIFKLDHFQDSRLSPNSSIFSGNLLKTS